MDVWQRIRDHIRSNVVGYLALFVALTITPAWAATVGSSDIKRNAVRSKHIKTGNVKRSDIGANAVNSAKVADGSLSGADLTAGAVTNSKLANDSVGSAKTLDGSIGLAELATNSVNSEKVVGGSLTGADFADGTITSSKLADGSVGSSKIFDSSVGLADLASNSVNSDKVADNSLTGSDVSNDSLGGDDVQESTLGQVPSALLGGLGRSTEVAGCDPPSTTFVTCRSLTINLPAPARALVLGRAAISSNFEGGGGTCVLVTVPGGPVPGSAMTPFVTDNVFVEDAFSAGVTNPLPAGNTLFALDCNQTSGPAQFSYAETALAVVVLSPN